MVENPYQSPESEAERLPSTATLSCGRMVFVSFLSFGAACGLLISLAHAIAFVEKLSGGPHSNYVMLPVTLVCVLIATTVGVSIAFWKQLSPDSKGVFVAAGLCGLSPLAVWALLSMIG